MIDHSALAKSNIDDVSNNEKRLFLDVFNLSQKPLDNPMSVKHLVKGNDIYVECVISNFTFSKREGNKINQTGTGYLQLYLNGKKIDNIYTAAFIIKGLPAGKHLIKLELVHNDGTPYSIEEEFEVTI